MSSQRYYHTISELKEVFSAQEANGLLKEGWELLKVSEVQRDEVAAAPATEAVIRATLLVYLLGRTGR
jgi:hypothetical protein